MKLGIADIVTALTNEAIGTKVGPGALNIDLFLNMVLDAIETFDFNSCRQPGQAYIELGPDAVKYVVGAGVGVPSNDPNDYVIRLHRGKVGLYLKRHKAAPAKSVAVVVYTWEAYLADPEINWDEVERLNGCSHVLVAVLASAGEGSPLTPNRFVCNLAGGNNEAMSWTADEIRQKAREIVEYGKSWHPVAD